MRVGLYGRKSAKDDAGTDAESILVQYARGERWAVREGHDVVAKWADNLSAWSGKERPEFMAALAAVERGDIEILWVYGSDRFTRQGARKILDIMDRPLATRPRIYFDHESLCTWEEAHRFPLVVKAEVDRQYADRLSKNITDTKARSRDTGHWSARPPYGTRRAGADPRKLEPEPTTWPTVARIYELRAQGRSLRGIAVALNREHVPAPNGGTWASTSVRLILRNPVYEGWMVQKVNGFHVLYLDPDGRPVRVFAEDATPLPADLVRRAREIRDADQGDEAPRRATPLKRILRCAECGSRMYRTGGKRNRHYACARAATGQGCTRPASVQERSIEPFVRAVWVDIVAALDIADERDHAALAAMGARWYDAVTPADETQAAREAVAMARKRLERLRADRELGLWDDDLPGFATRVRDAQAALRDAERVAEPDIRLPDFAGLDAGELARLVADDTPAAERCVLYGCVLDGVIVQAARYRGEPWRDSRVVAVVPVSSAPRALD